MRVLLAVFISFVASTAFAASDVRVIDGDTFAWRGETYRIHGIDAPERGQTCARKSGSWACGTAATDHLIALFASGTPTCRVRSVDGYGRSIASCSVDGVDIAESLVANGLAWAFVRYSQDYEKVEMFARLAEKGVWTAETETPWDYRSRRWEAAAQEAPKGCPIKGNITSNGRIYHAPWSPWYKRTRINEAKGERWFCDEAAALAAGWRAPRVN